MAEFDREKFEEDLQKAGIEYDPKAFRPDWFTRFLLKFSPSLGFKRLSHKLGVKSEVFDKAHDLFSGVEKIDIIPLSGGGQRGFMLILDRNTSLWFYQDGDHFKYDGFEMGEYPNGDVTIFDQIKRQNE